MAIKINGNTVNSTVNEVDNFTSGIGAYHLSNTPELYEIQRTNNFMFEVSLTTDMNGNKTPLYRAGLDPTKDASNPYLKFNDPEEVIRVSVNKATIPTYSQEPISISRGNTSIKYAGKIKYSDSVPLKLYDFIGAEVKDIFIAWQALSGNPYTEKVGHASDYKKNAFLCEYTPDYQLVRRWRLMGCWVSNLTFGDYQYENADKVEIDATITYDRAYIDVSGLA